LAEVAKGYTIDDVVQTTEADLHVDGRVKVDAF
jgi:acyl CoA:acetate/3-ketoacid CoA transferase beta subunit